MLDKFKRLDVLSPCYQVRYKSKESSKTCIGAVFSIIAMILFAVALGFFSKDLITRYNPLTRLNTYLVPDSSIYIEDYPIAFAFRAKGLISFEEFTKDFTISIGIKEITLGEREELERILKVEPCTTEMFAKLPEFEQYAPVGNHFCVNPFSVYDGEGNVIEGEKPLVYKDNGEKWSKAIQMKIYKRDHITDEVFQQKYNKIYFVTILSRKFLDLEDFSDPVQINSTVNSIGIDNKIMREANIKLMKNRLETDAGVIFEDTETLDYFTFGSLYSNFSLVGSDNLLTQINFSSSTFAESNHREYLKVQTILAQVSGVFKGVTVFAKALLYFVARGEFYRQAVSDLFEVSERVAAEQSIKESSQANLNYAKRSAYKAMKARSKNVSLLAFICTSTKKFNKTYLPNEKVEDLLDLHSIQTLLRETKDSRREKVNNSQRIVFNKNN